MCFCFLLYAIVQYHVSYRNEQYSSMTFFFPFSTFDGRWVPALLICGAHLQKVRCTVGGNFLSLDITMRVTVVTTTSKEQFQLGF